MPKGKVGFDKGDPNINRTGLNRGSAERKWYNIQRIVDDAEAILQDLPKEKRLDWYKVLFTTLVSKMANIPATPKESLDRSIDVQGELDQAETNATKP